MQAPTSRHSYAIPVSPHDSTAVSQSSTKLGVHQFQIYTPYIPYFPLLPPKYRVRQSQIYTPYIPYFPCKKKTYGTDTGTDKSNPATYLQRCMVGWSEPPMGFSAALSAACNQTHKIQVDCNSYATKAMLFISSNQVLAAGGSLFEGMLIRPDNP
eukprot:1159741-Pelagomonas_calceolata.AAC.3